MRMEQLIDELLNDTEKLDTIYGKYKHLSNQELVYALAAALDNYYRLKETIERLHKVQVPYLNDNDHTFANREITKEQVVLLIEIKAICECMEP